MSYVVGDHVIFGPKHYHHRFRCLVVALDDKTDRVYVAIVKTLNQPGHRWPHGETFLCNLRYLRAVPALKLLAEAAG